MADTKIEPCACGQECYTEKESRRGYVVRCLHCPYTSTDESTEAKAIAAHNKVSRANAIAESYRGLFDAVEAWFEGDNSGTVSLRERGMWAKYNAVLDAEEGT